MHRKIKSKKNKNALYMIASVYSRSKSENPRRSRQKYNWPWASRTKIKWEPFNPTMML